MCQQFRLGAIGNGWEGGCAYLTSNVPPNTDVTFSITVAAPSVLWRRNDQRSDHGACAE